MTTTEQQIGALDARVENIENDLADVKKDVREVRDIMLKAQGGWKTMVVFGTLIAGITTVLIKFIAWAWTVLPR